MVKQKRLFMISLLLLMLTGCGMMDKASDALGNFSDEYGDDIMQAIDDLQNAEYQDGSFENNLESAREYLLTQMQEKYGIEFSVAPARRIFRSVCADRFQRAGWSRKNRSFRPKGKRRKTVGRKARSCGCLRKDKRRQARV